MIQSPNREFDFELKISAFLLQFVLGLTDVVNAFKVERVIRLKNIVAVTGIFGNQVFKDVHGVPSLQQCRCQPIAFKESG